MSIADKELLIQQLNQQLNDEKVADQKFLIIQNMQKIKEEIAVLRAEDELMQRPTEIFLPDIFEEKRAIPNGFLRSALFGLVKKGKRSIVKDEAIFSMSQYDIKFSGEYLDQNDQELWDTLIYLAKKNNVDSELRITLYELCKLMNLSNQKITRDRLIVRAKRLAFGKVTLRVSGKEYYGSLIDDVFIDGNGDGKLVIRYNKKMINIFSDKDYTLINQNVRNLLGDNQLARWIYSFYESHNNPIPLKLNYIQTLCRSVSELKGFKQKLKSALDLIKQAFKTVDNKSNWNWEITENNYLVIYKYGKPIQQQLFKRF